MQGIKRTRGQCLPRGAVLTEVAAKHPGERIEDLRAAALALGRCPFPSIEGNPPLDRERPYYDARWWARQSSSE